MKHQLLLAVGVCSATHCAAASYKPPEVVIQHMSTVFAGQGMCSVRFSVETVMGDGDAGSVTLNLSFRDKNDKAVAQGELNADLNDSTAGRYQEPTLEGPEFCLASDTKVVVIRARSEHEGREYDLLRLRKIRVSDFKPYHISFGTSK